jgi:hypothetical protein
MGSVAGLHSRTGASSSHCHIGLRWGMIYGGIVWAASRDAQGYQHPPSIPSIQANFVEGPE